MTSEHVSSFVTDLVEMAKAMERVPQLEQQVAERDGTIISLQLHNTDLSVSLEASRTYAAKLEQKVHDLEVANTAAELRFLECDDAKTTMERALRDLVGEAQGVLAAVEMAMLNEGAPIAGNGNGDPSPFASPDVTPSIDASSDGGTEGQSEHPLPPSAEASPVPTSSSSETPMTAPSTSPEHGEGLATMGESVTTPTDTNNEVGVNPVSSVSEGVSVPSDPTLAVTSTTVGATTTEASGDGVSLTATPSTDAPTAPSPGPYFGKRYIETPGFIPLSDWLAGGGTDADYYLWRSYTAQS